MVYPHQKPLTTQQDNYLKKVYYTDKNFFGRDKLFKIIEKQTEVPRIYKAQVAVWLKAQKTHVITTKVNKQTKSRPTRATKSSTLQIDLIDVSGTPSKGHKYILNVIDIFSKYVWSFPLRNNKANTVKSKILSILQDHPNFKVIQSDNGAEFQFQIEDLKHIYGSPYTPQSQGVVESFNRTLRSLIRRYTISTGNNNWSDVLNELINNYNNAVSTTTKDTPANVLRNYDENQIEDLNKIQEERFSKAFGKANVKDTLLKVGTRVRTINRKRMKAQITDKTLPYWNEQIYTVAKILKANANTLSRNRYKLEDVNGKLLQNTYNITQLQIVSDNEQEAPNYSEPRPTVKGKRNIKRIRDLEEGDANTRIMS